MSATVTGSGRGTSVAVTRCNNGRSCQKPTHLDDLTTIQQCATLFIKRTQEEIYKDTMDHNTFISNLIRLCADEDGTLPERLRFYTGGKEIIAWIDISDVFEWGTADSYTIEHEDLGELLLTILDPNDALVLLVCKRRNQTPASWFLRSHPQVEEALWKQ